MKERARTARRILAEEGDAISRRPLTGRIALAAASFDFWLERLGWPDVKPNVWNDWNKLHALVKALPDEQRDLLASDMELQLVALRSLQVPAGYFRFTNRIIERAWEAFSATDIAHTLLPVWMEEASACLIDRKTGGIPGRWLEEIPGGEPMLSMEARQRLDAAGITHARCVQLMNAASAAINDAYIGIMRGYGIDDPSPAVQVRDAVTPEERADQYSAWVDENGFPYYRVGDRSMAVLDPRLCIHIAFHEPHHDIQRRLMGLRKAGLPEYLDETVQIFDMHRAYQVVNCPPTVFFVNDWLRHLAMEAYRGDPVEETALYQGWMAELHLAADSSLGLSPVVQHVLGQKPYLTRHLPPDIRSLFENHCRENAMAVRVDPRP
ncbi:MAG: hypothetical protein M3O22_01850 [Pseudomonadota bacterium]|nr:hypothetical protein [Pseudomonadota bacterium]